MSVLHLLSVFLVWISHHLSIGFLNYFILYEEHFSKHARIKLYWYFCTLIKVSLTFILCYCAIEYKSM